MWAPRNRFTPRQRVLSLRHEITLVSAAHTPRDLRSDRHRVLRCPPVQQLRRHALGPVVGARPLTHQIGVYGFGRRVEMPANSAPTDEPLEMLLAARIRNRGIPRPP